ncbi:NADP-dependent isocitrate dehydrogenase [Marinivivus vitaminiproducens]|uniref:NADP-dependent isocitrate dehydrogenase n=1 Tax=Marinivivus vitaminiproducens TaxID=3035935 RepID=UPI00279FAF7B|nr:NADP-dependent isocitrate dehydrogenase [Geminicoccaceae bacterium SCSIO 64248]
MTTPVPITVAHGDGIGPEIMPACLRVLDAAGAKLAIETIAIGESVYAKGVSTGIEPSAWESLRRTKVFYKAPIVTPQGGGYKSLNVTVRGALGLYANVRPCVAYHPFVRTRHPGMDLVIIRENEEDVYSGIEHQQTADVVQCLKLISRPGCEKIVRYAFEYARAHGRRKVTSFVKDNIMKLTDGLFHQVFDAIAKEYPDIETDSLIVDIGAARLADTPEMFDVLVMPNLYGDIMSDIAAQVAGSVGLAGSANIGDEGAMFEAIHGSAPPLAGKDVANPSGLLLAGVMMLVHIGQPEAAQAVHNAWLTTLEEGVHTVDVFVEGSSRELVGTRAFADAVIDRLGREPSRLAPVRYSAEATPARIQASRPAQPVTKETVGVDVFIDWTSDLQGGAAADALADRLKPMAGDDLDLRLITSRGVKVWPDGLPETFTVDHWRCRFMPKDGGPIGHRAVAGLLGRLAEAGVDFVKTEHLCTFDGKRGYSLAQGE